MYRLTYHDGTDEKTYEFEKGEVTIGRSPDCSISLRDFGISRTHAKVVVQDGSCKIVDMKSKNGTQVNGVPVVEAPLKEGDRVLLGKFELTFAKALEGKVVLDDEKPVEEAGTIMRSVGDISKLLELEAAKQKKGDGKPAEAEVKQIEKANRILKVLTKVAETLIASRPMAEVLHQVMEIVFDHIPADRGFLMLRGADGELEPHVVKHRKSEDDSEGKITISRTIAKKVIADRVAILTSDAQVDSRFNAGDSIRIQGIRSAMCAPMWNQDRVIGIIFVDSLMLTNNFGEDDLDLLAALANYAAVAVEHTRLNEKIAAEEKKRDRLGRFLSPQVASRILAASDSQDDSLGVPELREGVPELREVTVLLLSDYLSRMTDAVFKQEGTLDKYIGDAIMAVFGAPLDMPDHAERAIRAAIEMRERLDEFNEERAEGPKLKMRIGINTGKAVAGEIGSVNKKDYTVLGDTVNTASRLESSVAKPEMIVIGENTYAQVKDLFEFRPLGRATLKGKEKTVEAYEVLGEAAGSVRATTAPATQPEL